MLEPSFDVGRISVLCANAPKPNPGMLSVDMAFYALAKRYNLGGVRFYQVLNQADIHGDRPDDLQGEVSARERSPITYFRLGDEPSAIEGADKLIYWGDFSHMAHFEPIVARRYAAAYGATLEEGKDFFYRHFFMEGLPADAINKTIIFGETLLFNDNSAFFNTRYTENFHRFFSSAALVKVRDPISANQIAQRLGDFATNFLGVDCSPLLRREDVEQFCPKNNPEIEFSGIGVFFWAFS